MYWNTINRFCNEYMMKYKFPPSVIRMSWFYYEHLEREMIGDEFRVLIKRHRVRGCKVIIDMELNGNIAFILEDKMAKNGLICHFMEVK